MRLKTSPPGSAARRSRPSSAPTTKLSPRSFAPLLLLAAGFSTALLPTAQAQPPTDSPVEVLTDQEQILAAGFEPGEAVAWLGVARIGTGYITRVQTWREIVEADEEGLAVLGLDEPLPLRSVWVAVGINEGRAGVGVPPGRTVELRDLSPGAFPQGAGGAFRRLAQDLESAEVLVVRPGRPTEEQEGGDAPADGSSDDGAVEPTEAGRSAWARRVWDGAAHDADGAENASLALRVDDLEALPLPGSSDQTPESVLTLGQLRGHDVVVVIDPDTLRVGLVEGPGNPNEGGTP